MVAMTAFAQDAQRKRTVAIFLAHAAINAAAYIVYVQAYTSLFTAALGAEKAASLSIIFLAFGLVAEAVLEIPTGHFADRRGPIAAMRIASYVLGIHAILYVAASLMAGSGVHDKVFLLFVLAGEAFLALGTAYLTGAATSWFVRNMRAAGYTDSLAPWMARRRLVVNCTWLIAGSIALILKDKSVVYPFIFCLLLHLGIILFVRANLKREDEPPATTEQSPQTTYGIFGGFARAVRVIYETSVLRSLFVSHAIFWSLGLAFLYFWSDILKELEATANIILLAWVVNSFARVGASELAVRVGYFELTKQRKVFFLSQVLMGLPVASLMFLPLDASKALGPIVLWWFFFAFILTRVGQELSKPLAVAWLHEAIMPEYESLRATIESVFEAASGFGILAALGWIHFVAISPTAEAYSVQLRAIEFLGLLVCVVNIPIALALMRKNHQTIPARGT